MPDDFDNNVTDGEQLPPDGSDNNAADNTDIEKTENTDKTDDGTNGGNGNEDEKRKKIRAILIFIVVFVIVFFAVYFGIQIYNQLIVDKTPETTVSTTQSTEEETVDNPIDFESLQAANSDVYAYIKVDGTNVDYPIVQSSEDDEFYLKHSADDKSWSASGAVYTESCNTKTFNDSITLIYGHNGYGDTFFTTLHRFEDADFFNSHPYFVIYTPERRLTYQIISAFKYDDRHIMNSFRFSDSTQLAEFQQVILNPDSTLKNVRAESELETTVNTDSKIVILSTCFTNQKSNRYLVCGVLVKDEKTN